MKFHLPTAAITMTVTAAGTILLPFIVQFFRKNQNKEVGEANKTAAASASSLQHSGTATLSASSSSSSSSSSCSLNVDELTAIGLSDFLGFAGKLKTMKRTGWVDHEIPQPESVSDHMYRMGVMSLILDASAIYPHVNTNRCIQMSIIHDLAESITGDITPTEYSGVSKAEKSRLEREAMRTIVHSLPQRTRKWIMDLWEEYEAALTDEAKLVKELDKIEMIMQACEYEIAGNTRKLQRFYDSVDGKINSDLLKQVQKLIVSRRPTTTG